MIKLLRMVQGQNTTLGHLYINEVFQCYTLEDLPRKVKIPGKTCIPEGEYTLGLNKTSGMNLKYQGRYPGTHQGMVEIRGIPNFSLVFLHIGNYHRDTAGCPLLGSYYQLLDGDYRVLRSADAYKQAYPLLVEAAKAGAPFLVRSLETSGTCTDMRARQRIEFLEGRE